MPARVNYCTLVDELSMMPYSASSTAAAAGSMTRRRELFVVNATYATCVVGSSIGVQLVREATSSIVRPGRRFSERVSVSVSASFATKRACAQP